MVGRARRPARLLDLDQGLARKFAFTCLRSFRGGGQMDAGLREEILSIHKTADEMTVATIRPDGYPQATAVNYVSDGFLIYFGCAAESQKVRNIACSDKVSLTVTPTHFNWEDIRGLSIGGRAAPVTDPQEINRVSELMLRKFPQILRYALAGKKGVFLIRITPEVISVLDYRNGFGHTVLVKI
jgi:Pyridoxamine 5'-phosphate oxidase